MTTPPKKPWRSGITTDGIWGIRSNHLLNINVDGLSVTKQ